MARIPTDSPQTISLNRVQDLYYRTLGMPPHVGSGFHKNMRRALSSLSGRLFDQFQEGVYVWSDLHLGHENIIQYTNRPFQNADTMNAKLWRSWGEAASIGNTMVVIGDVALSTAVEESTWQRIRSMPCHQILVAGNHDLRGKEGEVRTKGFNETCSLMVSPGNPCLLWTHYPLYEVPNGCVNVHGHAHNAPVTQSPHINVSVEQLNYQPVELKDIRVLATELVKGFYPSGSTTIDQIKTLKS